MVGESQLIKRFAELSTSQQSVETLSLFLMHHRRQILGQPPILPTHQSHMMIMMITQIRRKAQWEI